MIHWVRWIPFWHHPIVLDLLWHLRDHHPIAAWRGSGVTDAWRVKILVENQLPQRLLENRRVHFSSFFRWNDVDKMHDYMTTCAYCMLFLYCIPMPNDTDHESIGVPFITGMFQHRSLVGLRSETQVGQWPIHGLFGGGYYMCQGLNSHYFHIIGDGHQPNSRGLYTHYKDFLLKMGWPSPI